MNVDKLEQEKLVAIIEVLCDGVILENKGLNTEIKQFAYKSLLAVGWDMKNLHELINGNILIGDNVDFTKEDALIKAHNESKQD